MSEREIFITRLDKERLEELLEVAKNIGKPSREDAQNLRDLERELQRAQVVAPDEVPADVVTMNSKVVLRDLKTSEEMTYTLVFPRNADIAAGAISVLAPVGTAILGYREGDEVEWRVPAGMRRIAIQKILYQPEAAGDFHL
jgi:regulator of nucleoside diphosphate kinase